MHVPFAVGAGAIVLGIVILAAGHGGLASAERRQAELDARGEPGAGVSEVAEAGSGSGSWPLGGTSSRDARRRAKKGRAFLRAGA
ncbi:hypothetical protein GCM10010402_62120 [Actinomadura luteofluorescens]|uniref:hypothetical protein n=1 Tax=Actinomadura luteofluorescens TaxID=46163 RepID=UPI0021646C0E|nr:hypothetical protein [Actinomadura glauciflava]MCR3742881.1 hypothetical protein [Actinomadura glauciflava]